MLGICNTDLQGEINDFSPGIYTTFGKFDPAPGVDDFFHTELCLIWHSNPVYTNIHWYHFIQEARYNGGEVIHIAPDAGPSSIHADIHVPVRIGSDAALALALCQTMIEEGLVDEGFVKEQTDLPLLIREDDGRFLRTSDLDEGGREDQFYWLDRKTGRVVPAPLDTLALGEIDPALEGEAQVALRDGSEVTVRPGFARLREHLDSEYTPESVQATCAVHPDTIRMLARKVASRRTRIMMGWNSGKYYHGDLMERAMMLMLGLSGNWGKPGTGARSWAVGMNDGIFLQLMKERNGRDETRRILKQSEEMLTGFKQSVDPTMSDELATYTFEQMMNRTGSMTPPAFFWYEHCGYKEIWNREGWGDPTMRRPFDEYLQEALERGWWDAPKHGTMQAEPRFLIEVGGNLLRRQRGGANMLLKHLWPKLKTIVSVDWRLNTTGLYADYVLPAAQHYEKFNMPYASPAHLNVLLIEKAAEPAGEAKSEWQMILGLSKALEERAKARGLTEYLRGGETESLDGLYERVSRKGAIADDEDLFAEIVDGSAVAGTIPEETTLESMKETGYVRAVGWGNSSMTIAQQSDINPNETHSPFRNHVEKKVIYPTLVRRAQFYIDHDWYLEAGEQLPVHKENPRQGGNYPLLLTSGHPRWSIHSMNHTNRVMLGTHRGYPLIYMNPGDMESRGLEDDQEAEVHNDMGKIRIRVRHSPGTRPGQVIIYNGYEPFQFVGWKGPENVEPGMVKWLHLAGGYGHLQYRGIHWQPIPIDRAVHVEVAPTS
jgi:DMSO reductase family type II enzyme molybdopterin subunit